MIVSKALEPFIEALEIDSNMNYSPVRPLSKSKSKTSDHFPLIVTFHESFTSNLIQKRTVSHTIWNTRKEEGWNLYKELTEEDKVFEKVIDLESESESASTTTVMRNIDKTLDKIRFTAFGKVKLKSVLPSQSKPLLGTSCEELLKAQREQIEFEFTRINEITSSKG